ncbi:MAG: RDD family protein [Planctomycetota bacterium]|nr:RDD family protein [Planctomycetota bacterium]
MNEPASLLRRATASASTFAPACVYVLAVAFCAGVNEMGAIASVLLVYLAPSATVLLEGSFRRGTYGMRLVDLRIGTRNGGPIGFWWCLVRIFLGVVLLPLLPVSAIIAFIDDRHRTLADLICGTAVWHEPQLPDDGGPRRFQIMPLEERQHL